MPYVPVPADQPGIRGLLAFKPASGVFVARMIHQLLRGDSPMSAADRERIAAYVSQVNDCEFCARSHAAAMHHLELAAHSSAVPAQRAEEPSPLLAALLEIAGAVIRGGHFVTDEKIDAARAAGADDETIHDTVLIAAAFCMVNRYVDGLGAITPTDDEAYDAMGVQMAAYGYVGAAPPNSSAATDSSAATGG